MSKISGDGANHAEQLRLLRFYENNYEDDVVVFDETAILVLGCGMALWIGKPLMDQKDIITIQSKIIGRKGAIIYIRH